MFTAVYLLNLLFFGSFLRMCWNDTDKGAKEAKIATGVLFTLNLAAVIATLM